MSPETITDELIANRDEYQQTMPWRFFVEQMLWNMPHLVLRVVEHCRLMQTTGELIDE